MFYHIKVRFYITFRFFVGFFFRRGIYLSLFHSQCTYVFQFWQGGECDEMKFHFYLLPFPSSLFPLCRPIFLPKKFRINNNVTYLPYNYRYAVHCADDTNKVAKGFSTKIFELLPAFLIIPSKFYSSISSFPFMFLNTFVQSLTHQDSTSVTFENLEVRL